MVSKGKIIGFIIVSALCIVIAKAVGIVLKLFLGSGGFVTYILLGLAAVWVLKETRKWLLFPLTSLVFGLIFDISATIRFTKFLDGTSPVYSLMFAEDIGKIIADAVATDTSGAFAAGATAAAALYNISDTIIIFALTMLVSFIAKCIMSKRGNNTIKNNGGKEND